MTIIENAPADKEFYQSWRLHAIAAAILIALILVEYRDLVVAAVQVWWIYPTYSHCFLVIPISAWLIWEKRDQLKHLSPAVEPRVLSLLPALLVMWALGELSTINEVRQLAVVSMIIVAIVSVLGLHISRQIWFPLLYLLFLVPTGEYLIGPMQQFATQFTDVALNLLGVVHHTEGTTFELTNGRYEIAEACAGLRFLIATVTLGILYAYLMFRRWYKIVLFLLSSIIVPLIGNGLRCVGIILLAHYTNNQYGAGADHLVYGWGFNVAILLVVFFVGSFYRDTIDDTHAMQLSAQKPDPIARVLTVFVSTALLVSMGPAVASWHSNLAIAPDLAALNAPLELNGWRESPVMGSWQPFFLGADANLSGSLISDRPGAAETADFYVEYYARARAGHSLTAHLNTLWDDKSWRLISSRTATARFGGVRVNFQESVVSSGLEKRLIWSSYWVDGRFTPSVLGVKFLQTRAALQGHEGEALFAVSTIVEGTDDAARQSLSDALKALGDLPDRLNAANHRPVNSAASN